MTPTFIHSKIRKADLYRLVFNTRAIKYVVAAMMLFFVLHPVMPAFASELAAEETAAAAAPEPEPVAPEVADVPDAPEAVPAELSQSTPPEPEAPTVNPVPDEPAPDAPSTDVPSDGGDLPPPEGGAGDGATPEEVPEVVVQDDAGGGTEENVPQPDASDTASAEAELADDTGTTTVPEPEYVEVPNTIAHTDTHYQFNKAQCVSMGGGAFHCFEEGVASAEITEDALYVDRDSDGDKEVFLRTGDETIQITNNRVDDDAPYFDAVSNTIVWHRLEAGQYAVYSYQDKRETLVSEGYGSSMEPHRAGQYTVWQSWIDDRWQVVLHDGVSARVISTGAAQSIAPQVEGAYVIWNITTGTTHAVAVYEIATGLTSVIDDGEGARVMNPRFVLVYDTKFENGDVITKGYDAETGDLIPLAAAAPIVPKELPSSDQTGETRALLQNKSSSREEFNDDLEPTDSTSIASSTPTGGGTASTTDALVVTTPGVVPETLPLTDFDIIVEPFSTTTSSQ